jgi:hypothetical protein
MKLISKWSVFKLVLSSTVIFPSLAYAYIDPGTGSMMIQALLALIATVSVSIGIFWRRIRSFFTRLLGREKKD